MVYIGFQYFWNFLNSEEGTGANVPSCPRDHILVSCAVVQSAPGLYFVADFKIAIYNLVNI